MAAVSEVVVALVGPESQAPWLLREIVNGQRKGCYG